MGRRRRALAAFSRAAECAPDDHEVLYNLGSLSLQMGRVEEALPPLERARALEPGSKVVAVRLAEALLRAERAHEAMGLLESWVREEPSPLLHRLYGMAAVEAGAWGEARDHLKRALEEEGPSRREVLLALALAYLKGGGGRDAALRLRERALELPAPWSREQRRLLRMLGPLMEKGA